MTTKYVGEQQFAFLAVILAKAYRRQLKDLIPSFWPWIGRNPVTRMFITLRYAGMDPAVKPRDDELELRDDEEVYEISVKMEIAVNRHRCNKI